MSRRLIPSLAAAVIAGAFGFFTSATAAPEPVKIGAIFAVTGPASNLGSPEAKTAEMVVDKMNAKGGMNGHKIVLLIKDSGSDPTKALSLATQLIEEEKVFAIIGPSTTGETQKIKAKCNDAGVILVSCASAEAIVNPVLPYVFKTAPRDDDAVRHIYETMKTLKLSKIAITSSNTGFGKFGKAQLEKLAPDYGIEIVANEVYEKEATDLTGMLTKIKAQNPEALVNWSVEPAQSILAKNMKQIGLAAQLFQSHGFANIRYVQEAGVAANGIIFPASRLMVADKLPKTDPEKALLMKYAADYQAKYKEDVSTFGGHAYDALLLLSKAIDDAGSLDKEKVRTALESIHALPGTAGIFNLSPTDHNGLGMGAFTMLTVKKGKFDLYGQKEVTK